MNKPMAAGVKKLTAGSSDITLYKYVIQINTSIPTSMTLQIKLCHMRQRQVYTLQALNKAVQEDKIFTKSSKKNLSSNNEAICGGRG
jgi:hypothetical protein